MKEAVSKSLAVAVCSMIGSVAHAQSQTHSWVSGVGVDSTSCTIDAPCRTLTAAINSTVAGGEVSILDSGPYTGPITINKALTIDAIGAVGTVSATAGADVITIAAGAADVVTLRGLSINASGGNNGIVFNAGSSLHVENCTIFGATQGLLFQPSSGSNYLLVSNTSFRNNSGGGVYVVPGPQASAAGAFNRVRLERNGTKGLRVDDGSTFIIRDSISVANGTHGFAALSTSRPVTLVLENVASSSNQFGVYASGALATVRMSNATLNNNTTGVNFVSSPVVFTYGDNKIFSNGVDIAAGSLTAASKQ